MICRPRPWIASGWLVLALVGWPARTEAQARYELRDGRVWLSAANVPVQELLKLWESKGGTRILYAEKLLNDPVTVELEGVPEREALDFLLRSAVGYLVRERASARAGQSRYELLLVLADTDVKDGGAAARRAIDEALRRARPAAERIVDYRDLPPRDPGDPNGPVGLTPASPGDVAPPPLAFPEGREMPPGSDPGVNPIPLGIPPPPPPTIAPTPPGATAPEGGSRPAAHGAKDAPAKPANQSNKPAKPAQQPPTDKEKEKPPQGRQPMAT